MILEKVSVEELNAIRNYRIAYAFNDFGYETTSNFADSKYVLKAWEAAKEEHLAKLFGGNLIVKKHFNYQKSEEELCNEINDFLYPSWKRSAEKGKYDATIFRAEFNGLLSYGDGEVLKYNKMEVRNNMYDLMSSETLAKNKYEGPTFEIKFNEEKSYRVSTGCKVSKALGKIADGFKLKGYENFRICHSQVLNQKELGGQLVLSIHPIDYMTMSDNDCEWSSCMSWKEEGEYRQGTVEMMNSNCVVVAYLESESPMDFGGMDWSGNKKWRQLFIINEGIIAGVKAYPYYNEDLSNIVANWLKDLAKENLGWEFEDVINYSTNHSESWPPRFDYNENSYEVKFYTDAMYNDFGACTFHHVAINKEALVNSKEHHYYSTWNKTYKVEVPYSGKRQCMVCGEIYADFYNEGCLACYDCQDVRVCAWCEDHTDDLIEYNGEMICSYCYNERFGECDICENTYDKDDMNIVYIIPRFTKAEQKAHFDRIYNGRPWTTYDATHEYSFLNGNEDFIMCEACFEALVEDVEENGGKVYTSDNWSGSYFVYFDELPKNYKDSIHFSRYTNNDEFKEQFNYMMYNLRDLGELTPLNEQKKDYT